MNYLGVTLNAQLSWNNYVKSVISSANHKLAFIKTIAFNSSTSAKLLPYILEYGVLDWLPQTKKQVDNLEKVQKRATRFILIQKQGALSHVDR